MFDNCSEIYQRFEIKANSFNSSASAVKSKCYPDMFRNNRGVNYKSDTPLNENFWQYGLSCGSNMNYAAAFSNSMTKSIEGLAGLTPLQRQQLLSAAAFQQRQKHLAQAMLARQQLALATALASTSYNGNFSTFPTTHQQQQQQQQQPQQEPEDEISKSLKMFAMLTAHKNGSYGSFDTNNKISTQAPRLSPVDVVMQDFANNGYVSDDLNRHHPMNLNHNNNNYINNNDNNNNRRIQWTKDNMTSVGSNNQNISNDPAAAIPLSIYNQRQLALQQQQQQQQQIALQKQLNVHFNNNNIWKTTPSTATTGSAISPPINMFDLNNNNKKKLPKRFSVVKSDKYMAVKHCVFCENNNEPEAVVMSHAVRDALGRVLCPKLRTYICPICQASGDEAHTVKYCPKKPIITMDDTLRLANTGVYKQQMQV